MLKSTRIIDRIKAEAFGGFVGEKAVIKRSAGGAHWTKRDYGEIKRQILADPDLGKITDQEMANRYEVSRGYAGVVRNERGLKPVVLRNPGGTIQERVRKSGLVGKYMDRDVAARLGTSENLVRMVRNKMGLSPSDKELHAFGRDRLERWKCLPEQVGLSRRQWKRYVRSLKD